MQCKKAEHLVKSVINKDLRMEEIKYDKIWDILEKIHNKILCHAEKLWDIFNSIFVSIDKGPKIYKILTFPLYILFWGISILLVLIYISSIPVCIFSAYMIGCPIISIINTARDENMSKKKKILWIILLVIVLIVVIASIIGNTIYRE